MLLRTHLATVLGLSLLALAGAVIGTLTASDVNAQDRELQIRARGFSYSPAFPTVPVGTTVTWINGDREAHTVTSDEGLFDAEIAPRGRFTFTFSEPGAYFFFCQPHDWMIGEITVVAPEEIGSAPAGSVAAASLVQSAAEVAMLGYEFQPAAIMVAAGGTVTWTNYDAEHHTATGADQPSWSTATVAGGHAETVVFEEAGIYPYLCSIHPSMHGEVVVVSSS